jgi:hypothetical protein
MEESDLDRMIREHTADDFNEERDGELPEDILDTDGSPRKRAREEYSNIYSMDSDGKVVVPKPVDYPCDFN